MPCWAAGHAETVTAPWKPAAGKQTMGSAMAERGDTSLGAVYGPEEFAESHDELKSVVLESEEQ